MRTTLLVSFISSALAAQTPTKPDNCAALVPGTPIAVTNSFAPKQLSLGSSRTVQVEIFGHSENRGYHTPLQKLLDANPPLPGVKFIVTNNFIGGHEAWRWATKTERGYKTIDLVLAARQHPMIALCLFSNNASRPIGKPDTSDTNFNLFVQNQLSISDHLHNGGNGAAMVYLSNHRYKPANSAPSFYETAGVIHAIQQAAKAKKAYVKPGPEQHDLHWCCFSSCYARDQAHTNAAGDQLMAEAWYNLLVRELTGCFVEPYGKGTAGSGGVVPVLGATGRPTIGNQSFVLNTSMVRANAPLVYVGGVTRLSGPILTDILFLRTATASAQGSHRLTVAIPSDSGLHGVRFHTQVGAVDGASRFLGIALSQGLTLGLCR